MSEPAWWAGAAPKTTHLKARHASEQEYKEWVDRNVPERPARWNRLRVYRRFVEHWPRLDQWFAAPLAVRLGYEGAPVRANGRSDTQLAAPYLIYLSLVRGIRLDFDYLLARKFNFALARRSK